MGVVRKGLSIGTLGTVGWNGQRATRAKNQKAQAALARAEVDAKAKLTDAEISAQKKITNAEVKLLKAQTRTVVRAPASSPAGWHRDPHGRHEMRYWDGARWTEHVSSGGVAAVDPA